MTHICEADECMLPICDRCRKVFKRHFCRGHEEHSSRERSSELFSWGPNIKKYLQTFKNQEAVFLAKIQTQFSDLDILYHPRTEKPVFLKENWKLIEESNDESSAPSHLSPDQKENIPLNCSTIYEVNLPKGTSFLPDNAASVLIEAKFCFNWEKFHIGEDGNPVNMPWMKNELLSMLTSKSKSAQKKDKFILLALFSPSGWNSEAIQTIEGEGKFASPNLSIILITESCLHFDKGDNLPTFFAPLFGDELLKDWSKNIKAAIEKALLKDEYIFFEDLRSALPYPSPAIRMAILDIAREGDSLIFENINGVGDVLRKRC